jgi:hypothetical protein
VWSVGASYTLAPGLQLVAEYLNLKRNEDGYNFSTAAVGTQNNTTRSDVVLLGTRIAF